MQICMMCDIEMYDCTLVKLVVSAQYLCASIQSFELNCMMPSEMNTMCLIKLPNTNMNVEFFYKILL